MTVQPNAKKMTSRDVQAAERKEQILDVAERLFAEKGYHATSMRELNKAIGMAEALTYHYFPGGKLEILHAVLQEAQEGRMKRISAFLDDIFQADLPLKSVLMHLITGLTEHIETDQHYFQIWFREGNLLTAEHRETLENMTRQPFAALAAYLSAVSAKGQVRPMDYALAASQFLSHIVMLIVQNLINHRTIEPEEAERLTDFYVHLWGG